MHKGSVFLGIGSTATLAVMLFVVNQQRRGERDARAKVEAELKTMHSQLVRIEASAGTAQAARTQ